MIDNYHVVALVIEPKFGKKIIQLRDRCYVWAVSSKLNKKFSKNLWLPKKKGSFRKYFGITLFNVLKKESSEDIVLRIIENILDHHGDLIQKPMNSVLIIYGKKVSRNFIREIKRGIGCKVIISTQRREVLKYKNKISAKVWP